MWFLRHLYFFCGLIAAVVFTPTAESSWMKEIAVVVGRHFPLLPFSEVANGWFLIWLFLWHFLFVLLLGFLAAQRRVRVRRRFTS